MKISIFGLGYVGAVSAACLARDGHHVIGCDLDPDKLALLREGRTPIIEAGMEDLISSTVASGRLAVTDDVASAVHDSEVSFTCVGTPSSKGGGQDLRAVERLSEQLGRAIRTKESFHVIVTRSTVLPGTVEEVILPIVEKHSGKKAGNGFGLCFQPEFLREGSSIKDYDNPPFTVVGIDDDRSAGLLHEIFGHLPCEFVTTSIRSAEMLKYCCNSFHALKITFANEIARVCQALGIDSHEVMRLVCMDRELNISPAYLKPGFAFGGSCLPKDVRALMSMANSRDLQIPMFAGMLPSNRVHIEHAVEQTLQFGKKKVGMIGLSFKTGTDDLRESPLVTLAETFIGKGLDLRIYDPEVNVARLVGANKRYIEESIPHISSLMTKSVEEVIQSAEVLLVGLRDSNLMQLVHEHTRPDQIILDLVDIPDRASLKGRYHGVCW